MSQTIFEKIWNARVVKKISEELDVLYIDKHFIHEVTSPQAFNGLENKNLNLFRPAQTIATVDHNIPTKKQHLPIQDPLSKLQVSTLENNCAKHEVKYYGIGDQHNGIVHVIGPELGLTQPGITIVCGDSHTSTHGAFGCIAFGIGATQIQQVFAAQCVIMSRPKTLGIEVKGIINSKVTAKDLILHIIKKVGVNGGAGYFIEFFGEGITHLSMEERMTICNMSIEMGARGGLVGPDETTYQYLEDKPTLPKGKAFEKLKEKWTALNSDKNAVFDKKITIHAEYVEPMITYGTSPDQSIRINDIITKKNKETDALKYMNFKVGESLIDKKINYVFIGSCTNGRIEDLRLVAKIIKGKRKAKSVKMWIVPGSQIVSKQAANEGLVEIFKSFGAEFRSPGCSACLAMNDDKIPMGALCISTSNRNYEGRQGKGARTILASPATAAVAAIHGTIKDPRQYL
ncbi:3-isopropylmalate dehydratase large subunit [Putridiphycobacter roseus]|uniref:3-isopropylmalate dehydratase n=1 Tax=Putridiphycobacter roseus TaxID=2219161 RepID=A0A2W1NM21_9FLAO|nr:3-isopropylmalate dehydratase large subunit [Putridiphycobacter roseus]PZE15768.1 3-isopropylmalate dehydratase large subunit [Putridiphycobacter roseus]